MWNPENYQIAVSGGPVTVNGYVRGGLGLHMIEPASPKGRRKAWYSLTHLNTGYSILHISGPMTYTAQIANEIFDLLETWDFSGAAGWKNLREDLPDEIRKIMTREGKKIKRNENKPNNHDIAKKILEKRECPI